MNGRCQGRLALIVLFHDVGHIFGRAGHHKQITEVYDFVWGEQS
jgi:hypothetical protein